MKTRKALNIICFAAAVSLTLSAVPSRLHAASSNQKTEMTTEKSGFDENAHGEVVQTGSCGEWNQDPKPSYRLYEDGVLYIYGEGTIGETSGFDRLNFSEAYIDTGITGISLDVFSNCTELEKIHIPESVTYIGEAAFRGCTSLKNIDIPSGVERLSSSVFYGCSQLTTVSISESVTSIDLEYEGTFDGCESLLHISVSDNNPQYASQDGGIYNKEKTTLLFYAQGRTEFINFPETLSVIGTNAFSRCKKLRTVTIPDRVNNIEFAAFMNCTSLETVNIPNHISLIKSSTFYGCKNLTDIKLPDNLLEIGPSAFYGCSNLKNPLIPNQTEIIGQNAFWECENITEIKIPNSVKTIEEYAFGGYDNLVIAGTPGSEAEKYAQKYNITFKPIAIDEDTSGNSDQNIYPTCTQGGKIIHKCPNCNYTHIEELPPTGHKPSNWTIAEQPTIFQNGKEHITCTTCGKVLQERSITKLNSYVKLSKNKLQMKTGKSYKLKIKKQSKEDSVFSWKSSKKSVAAVDANGKITAKKKGKAKITLKMKSGCKATCTVTVK